VTADEVGTVPLFEVEPVPAPPPAVRPSLADRQAERIDSGLHPLSTTRAPIRLHPAADRPTGPDGGQRLPYRCGSCALRQLLAGHARPYPKCLAHHGTRITNGPASDVREWWPACPQWTPKQETR
jgi:hypothetical protein